MFKRFYPYEYFDSVFDIDYTKLYKKGFRAVIFDIDNTLVHHGDDSNEQVDELFKHIHSVGLKTLLLSNNNKERIERFIKKIDTVYIEEADKPKPDNYYKALEMLGCEKEQAVVIGDQVFTDIRGANASGIPSILVKFIRLPNVTKIGKRRQVEKIILKFYRKNKKYQHRIGNISKMEER